MAVMKLFLTLILGAYLGTYGNTGQSQNSHSDEEKAALALKLLWSSNRADRELAKGDLLRLGEKAIPPLLALLEDINKNPSTPRFVTGREEEGKRLWEHFLSSPQEVSGVINEVEITSRLEYDIIDTLGELRAIDAIPILVEIMQLRIKSNWLRQPMEAEMIALEKIGKPAVPALIKLIKETEVNTSLLESNNPQITKEELLTFKRSSIIKIQTRAIIVLGNIGDKEAIPILERLLKQANDPEKACADIRYIQEAIWKINEKDR